MSPERILYPCYFDAGLQRSEGRRVPRPMAVKNPALADIEGALKQLKVSYHVEEKSHPGHWAERGGRVIANWDRSKEDLIRDVARLLPHRK
ncbi:signal recognition particle protein Srp19 [Methanoculleus sp. FWC-SCC1]|uniref:Signal recognition particle 19 kDa protein n=1 Tax=Methanoculleus frigidifontis TaxID=2584085 RepID=A0ABT8MDY8_9EURY|nr:signal recognition particle subunit SRP19/SEC65 family protein [Methanoculleus sp. FWC-SCC1]MDN7026155.1 signal recognition particle protein Srp19 [Methanoculleus sp. FWC-SCC1]